MGEGVNVFEVLTRPEFVDIAPKNLSQMKAFALACYNTKGYEALGKWVEEWILNMEYYVMREWDANEDISDVATTD